MVTLHGHPPPETIIQYYIQRAGNPRTYPPGYPVCLASTSYLMLVLMVGDITSLLLMHWLNTIMHVR